MSHKTLEIHKFTKDEAQIATLYIDNELSFINSNDIKDEIITHLNDFEQLNIQANIAHIDLTGIQLLYSIKKSCASVNKKVKFNFKMNSDLKNLVIRSGFGELFD